MTEQTFRDIIDRFFTAVEQKDIGIVSLYAEDAFTFGTGKVEITNTVDENRKLWEATFVVEEMKFSNINILHLRILETHALLSLNFDLKVVDNGMTQLFEGGRITMVFEKREDSWLISQFHNSVPQLGTQESIGWPTISQIQQQIDDMISNLGLNPNLGSKKVQIMKYLEKARAMMIEE
ncbi:MAG: YybH family protein [Candidatus Kariarchaeaceae archaeon]|jgi:ketosteroid isomerase-like protein